MFQTENRQLQTGSICSLQNEGSTLFNLMKNGRIPGHSAGWQHYKFCNINHHIRKIALCFLTPPLQKPAICNAGLEKTVQ